MRNDEKTRSKSTNHIKSIIDIESKFINDTLKGGGNSKEVLVNLKKKYDNVKEKKNKLQQEYESEVSSATKENYQKLQEKKDKIDSLNLKMVDIQTQISIYENTAEYIELQKQLEKDLNDIEKKNNEILNELTKKHEIELNDIEQQFDTDLKDKEAEWVSKFEDK